MSVLRRAAKGSQMNGFHSIGIPQKVQYGAGLIGNHDLLSREGQAELASHTGIHLLF